MIRLTVFLKTNEHPLSGCHFAWPRLTSSGLASSCFVMSRLVLTVLGYDAFSSNIKTRVIYIINWVYLADNYMGKMEIFSIFWAKYRFTIAALLLSLIIIYSISKEALTTQFLINDVYTWSGTYCIKGSWCISNYPMEAWQICHNSEKIFSNVFQ